VSGVAPMRYPLEPFFKLTGWTMRQVSIASGTSHPNATEYRLRLERGVTALVADRLAIKAGLHPAEIWPSWWDDCALPVYSTCEECGGEFLPRQRTQRFCSRQCNTRHHGREGGRRRYQSDPAAAERQRAKDRRYRAEQGEAARRARNARRRARYAADELHRRRILDAQRARRAGSITDKDAPFNKDTKNTANSTATSGESTGFAQRSSISPHPVLASMAS
jgi:lambda repressor-like predicted transcriptional regulator